MPELNATRERLRQARDAFRSSITPPAQQEPTASAQAAQTTPQAVAPQAAAPQPQAEYKKPDDIAVPVGFDNAFNNLTGQQPVQQSVQRASVDNNELQSAREENAKLMKELEELRKQREADQSALAEYNKLKEQQEIDKYLSGTEKLNTIDADDARKLLSPLLKTIKSEQASTQERFKAEREALDKRFAELDHREHELAKRKAYDTIMKAYPDVAEMQKHKAYQDIMSSPIAPGSDILVGTMVARDLQLGKTDYVLNVLKAVKDRMSVPDLTNVASVGGSSVAATPASDDNDAYLTPEQLSELKFAFQNRQISREEYHERLAKHREASRLRKLN